MTRTLAGRRRLIVAAALAALGVALLASLAIAAHPEATAPRAGPQGAACPAADDSAAQATARQLRRWVRCLINEERAVRGLGELDRDTNLQEAGQKHSKVMVQTDCLAHRCGDEPNLETRLRRAGYFEGAKSWQYAENTGCGLSAEAMVSNWMAIRFHRINILQPKFRDVGVGVTQKPVAGRCDQGYATFAVVLAFREPDAKN